ncbi:MAG: 8-oxoguanine DNA glycosylase [Firmicutes bacterium]|nr:8-oxoguanine DNA glycosylase [Bacillota bacterium]
MLKIKNNFDLKATVTCGQIFRFIEEKDNSFTIFIKDRVINLKEDTDYIIVESNNEEDLENIIFDYFDLNRDYEKIGIDLISKDSKIKDAVVFSKGLKMIHQDSFETLIAYIISQNNRVPSIANALNLLSLNYGKKVIFKDKEYYLFPSLEDLSKLSIDDFRNCKVGFRDKYLYEIIECINNKKLELDKIYDMSGEEALKYLVEFKGIGMKVASCILLFAYQKFDVYPVDTWVKKFMKEDYNIEGEQNIRKFTYDTYKEYSGLAIQYMFNYKRNKK